MPRFGDRKCLNCGDFFTPDPRSKGRQAFCAQVACRKASKRVSQQKWLGKPDNHDYFRGPENVQRVRDWRASHPGYARRSLVCTETAPELQEILTAQAIEINEENGQVEISALQDLIASQPVVLIGLIAFLSGSSLQEEIVATGQRLRQLGEDFLNPPTAGGVSYASSPLTRSEP
jgi:hypothetical protein